MSNEFDVEICICQLIPGLGRMAGTIGKLLYFD